MEDTNVWGIPDAVCTMEKNSEIKVLECGKDNEEGKCCCYLTTHTYIFKQPLHIASVLVKYKTGVYEGCNSYVHVDIMRDGNIWDEVFAKKARGHVVDYLSFPTSDTEALRGIRIREDGTCYLDRSAVVLEVVPR